MFFTTLGYSQGLAENGQFDVELRFAEGDLNSDGLTDMVIVKIDTTDATRPLKLEVFFRKPDSSFQLMVSTSQLMEAQYPAKLNGEHSGHQVPDFRIENGHLLMESYVNGMSLHTFLFRNGQFELIAFSQVEWDGDQTTTNTYFNLETGTYTKELQYLGSDEVVLSEKKEIIVKPLPTLQNFIAFQTDIY